MSLAAITKQLMILNRAGLISQEKRGRMKRRKLKPDALRDASGWMQSHGQFVALDMYAFERFLEGELEGQCLAAKGGSEPNVFDAVLGSNGGFLKRRLR